MGQFSISACSSAAGTVMALIVITELVGKKTNLKFRWKGSQVSVVEKWQSMEGTGKVQQSIEKGCYQGSTLWQWKKIRYKFRLCTVSCRNRDSGRWVMEYHFKEVHQPLWTLQLFKFLCPFASSESKSMNLRMQTDGTVLVHVSLYFKFVGTK